MIFKKAQLTKIGIHQRQIAIAESEDPDGRRVRFGYVVVGDGKPNDDSEVADMTEVVNAVTSGIVKRTFAEKETHSIVGQVTNSGITERALISEIAIYSRLAKDDEPPDTSFQNYEAYCYTYSPDDYEIFDPQSSINGFEMVDFGIETALSNAELVQLNYDTSTVFVTHHDLISHINSPEQHPIEHDSLPANKKNVRDAIIHLLDKVIEYGKDFIKHLSDADSHKALFDKKVDKINGKGLSTNDYTTAEKNLVATVSGKVAKAGDTMTGTLSTPAIVFPNAGTFARITPSTGSSGYGLMLRNSENSLHFLLTNNDDAQGGWNSFRPLSIDMVAGGVYGHTAS